MSPSVRLSSGPPFADQLLESAKTSSTNSATSAGLNPVAASTSTRYRRAPEAGLVSDATGATWSTDGSTGGPDEVVVLLVVLVLVGAGVAAGAFVAVEPTVVVVLLEGETSGAGDATDVELSSLLGSGKPKSPMSIPRNMMDTRMGVTRTWLTLRLYSDASLRCVIPGSFSDDCDAIDTLSDIHKDIVIFTCSDL